MAEGGGSEGAGNPIASTARGFMSSSVFDIPCYTSALGWGTATGVAAAVHKFRATRLPVAALDSGVKFFAFTTLASWYICRNNFMDNRKAANKEAAMAAMTPEQQAAWEGQRGIEYGGAPSSVQQGGAGGGGSDCGCADGDGASAPAPGSA